MALLEVKNLGISFGGLRAVDEFNVSIEKGELYGLIGPNGAGKTTVFNMLTGVYKPSKGVITLDGENITGKSTRDINRAGIARTFQNIRLFKEMSVKLKELENVDRYYKPPEPSASDVRIIYKDFTMDGLLKALSDLLTRTEIERKIHEEKEIPKEVFTVQDKMNFVREKLLDVRECSFFELFRPTASKTEIITTFQAMLELLKRQFIKAVQNGVFDDITITLNEERSEDLAEFGDLDEYN